MTSKRRKAPVPAPVTSRAPHPQAWKIARRMAGGNTARLRARDDGSVLVLNTAT